MRKLFLLLAFAITGFTAVAQPGDDKAELQQTKQKLQKEIEEYRQLLEKTKKDKKNYMSQLSLINSKINARLHVIDNINKQVKLIDDEIYRKEVEKNKLRKDLDTLKARYAKSMEYAYKNRSTYDYVNFLFSANGINDALRRMAYLKAYRAYREQQVEAIMNTQNLLKQKIEGLNTTKKQKGEVLNEQSQQLGVLEDDKKEKDQILKELKSQEKEINNQITARKAQQRKIDNAITAIIERERKEAIARAKKEKEEKDKLAKLEAANNNKNNAANNIPSTKTTGPTVKVGKSPDAVSNIGKTAAPESADITLSNRFEDNKGKLPWPVDGPNTFILMRYGQQELDKVKFFNNGLNFQTTIGAPVKVVFDGVVSSVIDLGDGDQAVFVRHGKYISSYVGLSSVNVSKGQELKTGQVIGKAGANDEGVGETQLLISPMDRGGYLNPELWIRRGK
jgi:septal ring factor EnvC (AmiA/AmiB activator)